MMIVPENVFFDFLEIDRYGNCNMYDLPGVTRTAKTHRFDALAAWLKDNDGAAYQDMLTRRFRVKRHDGTVMDADEFETRYL